jgi:hypothetical protein
MIEMSLNKEDNMLLAPVIEKERISSVLTENTMPICTVCQSESGVASPFGEHTCRNFTGVNDKKAGFVTFGSYDLFRIYRGLRKF